MRSFIFSIFLMSSLAWAHEGAHGPVQKIAPHGGVVRDGPTMMMELVNDAGVVKLYPLGHDAKPLKPTQAVIDVKSSKLTDAKRKPVIVKFVPQDESYMVEFEKSGSHRFSLDVVVKFDGKDNKFNWQIEPQTD